jgi:leader peptidase (prepilin peptidase)/N-methyltransferase
MIGAALFALLGACLASFVQVVADRTVADLPWWGSERSRCGSCGTVLSPGDLIPILSFLLRRGRCRTCGARIPRRYPAVELLSAVAAALIALRWGFGPVGIYALGICQLLLLNALTDWTSGFVFDAFAGALALWGAAGRLLLGGVSALPDIAAGGALGFSLIAVLILASRGGMGWGDAWFLGGLGAALGFRLGALGAYLGFGAGGIAALFLLAVKKVHRKSAIPLVPFLAFGGLLALLVGPELLAWIGFPPPPPWVPRS